MLNCNKSSHRMTNVQVKLLYLLYKKKFQFLYIMKSIREVNSSNEWQTSDKKSKIIIKISQILLYVIMQITELYKIFIIFQIVKWIIY